MQAAQEACSVEVARLEAELSSCRSQISALRAESRSAADRQEDEILKLTRENAALEQRQEAVGELREANAALSQELAALKELNHRELSVLNDMNRSLQESQGQEARLETSKAQPPTRTPTRT